MDVKNDKRQAAHRLIAEHMQFLTDQELLIQRMVECKWQEMLPQIERTIDRRIREQLYKMYNQN